MRKTRANARIILLLLALLPVMAPGLGEALPFNPGDILTSGYWFGITRVDPTDGTETLVVIGNDFSRFSNVVIAPDGDLLFADWNLPGQIIRYNPTTRTGSLVNPNGPMIFAEALAIGPDGNLLVAGGNQVIRVHLSDGAQTLISAGGNLERAVGIAVDGSGKIIVLERAWGRDRQVALIRIDPADGSQTLLKVGSTLVDDPLVVAIAANGDLFVADPYSLCCMRGIIIRINPADGTETIVTTGGFLVDPRGIALAANGDLIVGDSHYGIVRVDPRLGTQTLVASRSVFGSGSIAIARYFADVPEAHRSRGWIEAFHVAGISAGCAVNPLRFCPDRPTTRAELAVFLVRAVDGPGAEPPAATGTVFHDVAATDSFASFIERLWALGVTAGCGGGGYCPDRPVRRDELAVLLLRALHGPGYVPPVATGTLFSDISASHPYAAWIEQMAHEGITGGCATGPTRYCPGAPVTRENAAALLVRAFHLLPD